MGRDHLCRDLALPSHLNLKKLFGGAGGKVPPDTEEKGNTMKETTAQLDAALVTAELVAKVVAGISSVGLAHRALEQQGWSVRLVANRMTVENHIIAQFVPGIDGKARWTVFAINGGRPVWIVGAEMSA